MLGGGAEKREEKQKEPSLFSVQGGKRERTYPWCEMYVKQLYVCMDERVYIYLHIRSNICM